MNIREELRKQGFKIRTTHNRLLNFQGHIDLVPDYEIKAAGAQKFIEACGGQTIVEMTTPKGDNISAVAWCNPKDCYNKRFGYLTALKRAIDQSPEKPNVVFEIPNIYKNENK